jgi:hypothetical protein
LDDIFQGGLIQCYLHLKLYQIFKKKYRASGFRVQVSQVQGSGFFLRGDGHLDFLADMQRQEAFNVNTLPPYVLEYTFEGQGPGGKKGKLVIQKAQVIWRLSEYWIPAFAAMTVGSRHSVRPAKSLPPCRWGRVSRI